MYALQDFYNRRQNEGEENCQRERNQDDPSKIKRHDRHDCHNHSKQTKQVFRGIGPRHYWIPSFLRIRARVMKLAMGETMKPATRNPRFEGQNSWRPSPTKHTGPQLGITVQIRTASYRPTLIWGKRCAENEKTLNPLLCPKS